MTYDDLINSFKIQSKLNKKIWNSDGGLQDDVRTTLLSIAKKFYDSIELENKPPIEDIVFTGSLANYNYSDLSDIDLHLIFDLTRFGEHKPAFEKLLLLAKSIWNDRHKITVRGFQVEIYAEDKQSPHHSTGMYSVLQNTWIKKPQKKEVVFDRNSVEAKLKDYIHMYKKLAAHANKGDPEELLTRVDVLRDKIAKYRKSGLRVGGEFSVENITFKALRRIGFLDRLAKLRQYLLDKSLSIESSSL